MPKLIKLQANKTYATRENAIKAVDKKFALSSSTCDELRYFITCTDDGRFFPLFIGQDSVQAGVHWHFNVVA